MSTGDPSRGCRLFANTAALMPSSIHPVSLAPGLITFAVMPRGASSVAAAITIRSSAPLRVRPSMRLHHRGGFEAVEAQEYEDHPGVRDADVVTDGVELPVEGHGLAALPDISGIRLVGGVQARPRGGVGSRPLAQPNENPSQRGPRR